MSDTVVILIVGVLVLLLVVGVVVFVLRRARQRSAAAAYATAEILDPDKKRILRMKAQAQALPAIPLIVAMVRRGDLPRQLEQADVAHEVTVEDVARMKLLLMLLFGALGAVMGGVLLNPLLVVLFGVPGMAVGFLGPDSTIKQAATVRQAKISRALPLALEVIGLAVERTSIDSGIAYYCQFFSGEVLAHELGYANQRVVQLKERLDVAMSELLRKNRNDDLSFLVAAVGQATQVGGRDLQQMLQGQSTELRSSASRRSRRAPCRLRCS